MSTFNVGDRVRCVSKKCMCGKEGSFMSYLSNAMPYNCSVRMDGDTSDSTFTEDGLELVTGGETMSTVGQESNPLVGKTGEAWVVFKDDLFVKITMSFNVAEIDLRRFKALFPHSHWSLARVEVTVKEVCDE